MGPISLEDEEQLVPVTGAPKERFSLAHLVEHASDGPQVDCRGVVMTAQQQLRRAIPHRHNLSSVWPPKRAIHTSQAKIGYFESAIWVHQHILRLEISVHQAAGVCMADACEYLVQQ